MADREIRETETVTNTQPGAARQTTVTTERASGGVVAQRIVWYIGGAIMVLLALRVIFQLLGANEANPFAQFIYGLSYIFAYPFFGLFAYEPSYGVSYLEVSTLVAIVIYAIATAGIAKLFTLNSSRTDV